MKLRIALVCLGIMLGLTAALPTSPMPAHAAVTYYVAKTGNDGTGDGTIGLPWLTIQHGLDQLTAGGTLYVRGGTYAERVDVTYSGTLLKEYPGESAIIDASGVADPGYYTGAVAVVDKTSIAVEGFEIKGNAATANITGIYADNSSSIAFRTLIIHTFYTSGIKIASCNTTVIDGCEVYTVNQHGAGSEENISIDWASDGFEIKNCYIHDSLQEAIDVKQGSKNGTIHNNTIEDSPAVGIYIDGYGSAISNIDIYSNWITGSATCDGIEISNETGIQPITDINIYNNVVVSCLKGFLAPTGGGHSAQYTLVNNTFYDMDELGIGDSGNHSTRSGLWRNNIIVAKDSATLIMEYNDYAAGGVTIDYNLTYSLSGTYSAGNEYGTSAVQANPVFVTAGTDFRLQSSSPARDTGTATGAPTTDYAGTSRPQGLAFDLGSYEYVVSSSLIIASPTSTPLILSASMFQHLSEPNDRELIFEYNIPYSGNVTYPTTPASTTIIITLSNPATSAVLNTSSCYVYSYFQSNGYGKGVAAFYFPASDNLSWAASYNINILGPPSYFDPSFVSTYTLSSPTNYTTASTHETNQLAVRDYVLGLADSLTAQYSSIPLKVATDKGVVLNSYGESYFRGAIPGIQTLCPQLFLVQTYAPVAFATDGYNMDEATRAAARLNNTDIKRGATRLGALFGLQWYFVLGGFVGVACLGVAIFGARKLKSVEIGLVGAGILGTLFAVVIGNAVFTMVMIAAFVAGIVLVWSFIQKKTA
jgi:hypothetical protein